MKKETVLKIGVTISYLFMIFVNGLANYLPLNGKNTGEISDSYPNLFAPAGFTFAIWGIIYLFLGGFVLYQWKKSSSVSMQPNKHLIEKIRVPFILTSLLNATWLFCWHYEFIALSTVFMVGLLVTLIYITNTTKDFTLSLKEKIFIKIPFSVYFGWITIATVANITITLVKWNWDGFGLTDQFWTILILLVALAIASAVIYRHRDLAYAAVIIWAYVGIASKHRKPNGWNSKYPLVLYTVYGSIGFLVLLVVYIIFKKRNRKTSHVTKGDF